LLCVEKLTSIASAIASSQIYIPACNYVSRVSIEKLTSIEVSVKSVWRLLWC
jgi:hypothetical protein